MCIYRPPSQNKQYFLDKLSEIINYYSSISDNYIVLGDFNMEASDSVLNAFMQSHSLFNLIKSNTSFKGRGSCIDLILINRKFCFENSSTFETGLSDHHHLRYSMLKQLLKKEAQSVSFTVIIRVSTMNVFKMILKTDCRNALKIMNYLKMYL